MAGSMLGASLPFLIAAVGIAHAIAAFCYFSKARHGSVWAVAWLALTVVAVSLLPHYPTAILIAFGAALVGWTTWWLAIRPSNDRRWVSENAKLATARIEGHTLTVENVRNFTWHGKGRHDARWETRRYNLDRLDAADLMVSTWGSPHIAHLLVSFTFSDAEPLCFSIETRRERTERWSTVAGFFRAYELMIIPGDEADHVKVRTTIRRETLRLFRLDLDHATTRRFLEAYVADLNALAQRPRFYHTIWTNCTTEIARLVRTLEIKTPLDWRLVLTGHVPEYLYKHGALGHGLDFDTLNAQADIGAKARAADAGEPFHRAIRAGLYDPRIAEMIETEPALPKAG